MNDPQVARAVREYLDALDAGRKPSRQEFLGRYPEIAGVLGECLDALEFVHTVGPRLEKPDAGTDATGLATLPLDPALPLGDYRIVGELGRGGMGIVYEAEQVSLGRRVALKILPCAAALNARQLQRFKNEARAAAHLHHTHIVPVYAVGCERGVHFYAMQLVTGRTLAAVIDELRSNDNCRSTNDERMTNAQCRRTKGEPPESLLGLRHSTFDILSSFDLRPSSFAHRVAWLGMQAARALEHAHQVGVIHRDIKPANLLVDGRDHLWVTDFGLAQIRSDAALTLSGDVVGTLRYMSPEQALAKRGLVDHRTDVYALGATLYELLTLRSPFNGRDREELLRQIAFEEPPPIRRLNPTVPTDLETIVHKALAKTPEERYATAQELADDLQRFREDRPIRARRPTFREKGARWCRRHKPVVLSAVVLLVLAALGLAASTVVVAREQARTRAAYEAEAEQRGRAERSFRQARRAVDFFARITEEELANRPDLQDVRRRMLQAALEYYRDFIDQRGDDPALRSELAESHFQVAAILSEIGIRGEAVTALEQAVLIQEGLVRAHPGDAEFKRGLQSMHHHLDRLRAEDHLWLLQQEAVQEDLNLSEEQVEKIQQLGGPRREPPRGPRHHGPEGGRKPPREPAVQERTLANVLRPEQLLRLRQIIRQRLGVHAFRDPEVAGTLALTVAQHQKVQTLLQVKSGSCGPGGARPTANLPVPEGGKGLPVSVFSTFTAEQKAHWQALTGKPFTGVLRLSAPPGHGHRHDDRRRDTR